ncbi:MAG: hypothetical protein HYS13_13455, partial [Planctomycetia bacterium]|nr:hypothetical protein [Planctomycetia bacterium]
MKTRRRAMQQPPPGRLWKKNRAGWQCPGCGKTFIQRGLWHSCGAYTLADHFRGRPRARKLFEAFRAFVKDAGGPFRLSIAKTRIGFIRGITFSGAIVRKDYLRSGFLLLRRLRSPRFVKVEHFPPYYVHYVEIRDASDLDDELRAWAREAYAVG